MKLKFAFIAFLLAAFAVHCPPGQVKKHMNPGHSGKHPGKAKGHYK